MRTDITIPQELAHLKIDDRGYPIPFFVSYVDGKPEFRYIEAERVTMIIEKRLCHICGKKLHKDYCYFISGPLGLQNRISSDAAMHRTCSEFSLQACPHLYFQKAQRRENDEIGKLIAAQPSPVVKQKPNELYLVKVKKFTVIYHNGQPLCRYTPHSFEKYIYIDNKLTKEIKN